MAEARDAALSLRRGTVGDNVMYFETGQGRRCRQMRITGWISKPAPVHRRPDRIGSCGDQPADPRIAELSDRPCAGA
ncbi:ethanolamine ammonia-lyase subunit EutB [Paracoccus amoyensis]|uniref:ethanolamine ammonia-lyase subunit EutB n=1 Tax=Paracoccus amoyensis TaxID=2760093 RepID=UPI001FE372E6|nr:ethanolamine ammonia-lyase subunit EutB [Paracoccus amoyensis]